VCRPLGMRDTYYCGVDAPPERRVRRPFAAGANPDPGLDVLERAAESQRVAAGSFLSVSTAWDMAILGQMFLNGGVHGGTRILSPTSVAEMTRNQIPGIRATFLEEEIPEASWGLGWSVHGTKTGFCGGLYSAESFEHWGGGGTYVWVDPVHEVVGAYFSVAPWIPSRPEWWAKHWRSDLFTDAVTAAIMEP
jgi:CubicO group peptidase (beta-lactamase class C family)